MLFRSKEKYRSSKPAYCAFVTPSKTREQVSTQKEPQNRPTNRTTDASSRRTQVRGADEGQERQVAEIGGTGREKNKAPVASEALASGRQPLAPSSGQADMNLNSVPLVPPTDLLLSDA